MGSNTQLFARLLRENRQRILEEWLVAAMRLPSAYNLPVPAIRDHVPEILDKLADAVERGEATSLALEGLANLHAALRAREGYDLRQVVAEYRTLRRVILDVLAASGSLPAEAREALDPVALMNAAMDSAISDAVDQYAVERDRLREMFISMLGHDLRDPLNGIAVGAQLLLTRSPELDPDGLKTAARIAASAERMQRMVQDLLDFARGRLGGGLPIVPTPLDALALIRQTVDEISHAHPERTIEWKDSRTAASVDVRWDGDRIAQAITNLMSNAITHGQDPIIVELLPDDGHITIAVRNRGAIPPEVLPTIFAPFSHSGAERRQAIPPAPVPERRRGSLGLGLYIVREIAQAHGGSVSVDVESDQTMFRLTLPRYTSGSPSGGAAAGIG